MPTTNSYRPFFLNFFAVFRAHSSTAFKASTSSTAGAASSSSSTSISSAAVASGARSIARKASASSSSTNAVAGGIAGKRRTSSNTSTTITTTATTTPLTSSLSPHSTTHPQPISRQRKSHSSSRPIPSPPSHHHHTHKHTPSAFPSSPPLLSQAHSQSPNPTSPSFMRGRPLQRRGSDSSSSSGGFRDTLGEKWYIGGRTGTSTSPGEEAFYRLGLVTRPGQGVGMLGRGRSLDRLSL